MRNAGIIIPAGTQDRVSCWHTICTLGTIRKLVKYGFAVVFLLGAIAACVATLYYWDYFERFQNWGYLSAFIFGFIAGSSLPVPLPYLVVTFSLGGLLNPALVGLASGIGAGIGGTLVYLVGCSGRQILPGIFSYESNLEKPSRYQRYYYRLQNFTQRRGSLAVFMMLAVLNPFFAPMAISTGVLRFGLWRFLFWCTLGNILKSMAIAYCGYFGLNAILQWTGG